MLLDTYLTGPLEFWKQSATGEGVRERTKRRSRGEASKRERESEGSGETVFFNWAPRPPEVRALVWVSFSLRARLQTIFSKRERQGKRESERERLAQGLFFFSAPTAAQHLEVWNWFRRLHASSIRSAFAALALSFRAGTAQVPESVLIFARNGGKERQREHRDGGDNAPVEGEKRVGKEVCVCVFFCKKLKGK